MSGAAALCVALAPSDPPDGFAKTNGRSEAERVDIATTFAGRLRAVNANEGDLVKVG